MPSLISKPLIQLAISGATRVDPAPVSPAADAPAVDTAAMLPTDAATAMKSASNLFRNKGVPFGVR
jgi:hypothetical protein